MGYRLHPNILGIKGLPTLVSSGIVPGTVQVTPSGNIIILMADAQTTGGYPRIGNLPQGAIYQLAQAKPGDKICFEFQEFVANE
jgi:antagonist of KipI